GRPPGGTRGTGGPSSTPGPSPGRLEDLSTSGRPLSGRPAGDTRGPSSTPGPVEDRRGRDRARWPAPPAQGAVHLLLPRRPAAPTPAGPIGCSTARAAPTRPPSTARRRVSTTATRRSSSELDVARATLISDELRPRRDEHGHHLAVAAQRTRRSGWGATPSRPGAHRSA